MFDDDPFAGAAKKQVALEMLLDDASIVELEDRIERLKTEIAACEKAIARKRAQRDAADSVFGRPS